jgi:hypothetical protein
VVRATLEELAVEEVAAEVLLLAVRLFLEMLEIQVAKEIIQIQPMVPAE